MISMTRSRIGFEVSSQISERLLPAKGGRNDDAMYEYSAIQERLLRSARNDGS
jgi:hypothetical protein